VKLWRIGAAIKLSLTVKPASAEAAVASPMRASSTRRLERSTSTPTEVSWDTWQRVGIVVSGGDVDLARYAALLAGT
jgi:hypothetical protein